MIGEELHRRDEDVRRAGGSDRREEVHEIGPQPLFVGMACALVRPRPAAIFEARGRRDALPRVLQLRDVVRLRLEHAAREAVRGEEHERVALRQAIADARGERRDE